MAPPGGSGDPAYLYGIHALREALRSRTRSLLRLCVIQKGGRFAELVRLAQEAGVPVHVEPRAALDRLVPSGKHQGALAVVGVKAYATVEEILAYARERGEPPCLVILDGVEDPHNLGAVLRSVEAAGAHGVCIPERRAAGLTGTVAKTSGGALEYVRTACVPNLSRLIEQVQRAGLWVYGLDAGAAKGYTELDLKGPCAVVLGAEGTGIRPGVLAKCDERAAIPMRGRVGSLNVSAAAAVVLFEMVRQRAGGGISGWRSSPPGSRP